MKGPCCCKKALGNFFILSLLLMKQIFSGHEISVLSAPLPPGASMASRGSEADLYNSSMDTLHVFTHLHAVSCHMMSNAVIHTCVMLDAD